MHIVPILSLTAASGLLLSAAVSAQTFPIGSSHFDVKNPTLLDGFPANNETYESMQGKLDSRFHDFDGDGDEDVLMWGNDAGANQGDNRPMLILRNETELVTAGGVVSGTPRKFVLWPEDDSYSPHPFDGIPNPQRKKVYDVAFLDVDNDGDEDFIAARLGLKDLVFLREDDSNGYAHFTTQELNSEEESQYALCLVGGTGGPAKYNNGHPARGVCTTDLNYPTPALKDYSPLGPCDRRWTIGISVADLNVVYEEDAQGNPVLVDGQPVIDTESSFPDIVLSYRSSPPRTYRNSGVDGSGAWLGFQPWLEFPMPPEDLAHSVCYPGNGTRDVHFTDLDGDGDQDCVFARAGGVGGALTEAHQPEIASVLVYENIGNAEGPQWQHWYSLKPPEVPGVSSAVDEPCLQEVPGEGHYYFRSASHSITVTDVDGNGHPDLIQPISGSTFASACEGAPYTGVPVHPAFKPTRVYLNSQVGGQWGYLGATDRRPDGFLGNGLAKNVEEVHVNGDANPDYYEATGVGNDEPDRIWLSHGQLVSGQIPTFSKIDHFMPEEAGVTNDNTRYAHFTDLDDDGLIDMLETNFGEGVAPLSRVFWGEDPSVGMGWTSRAMPGTSGPPVLTGTGVPTAGTPLVFNLANSNPSSTGFFLLSYSGRYQSYSGGVAVPDLDDPNLVVAPFTTPADPEEDVEFGLTWPSGVPFGTRFYLQAWIQDAGGPAGYAASNGLAVTSG